MGVGIELGSITDEIGSDAFLYAFFSTITGNLEPAGWGTRFPIIMHTLYGGTLPQKDAAGALAEIWTIRNELADLSPQRIIWSFEDRTLQPPWSSNISTGISNLADYFVTADGRDLTMLLIEVLEELAGGGKASARIVSY